MNLRANLKEIDIERLILVPVFSFLLACSAMVTYSHAIRHSSDDPGKILIIFHSILLFCFYLLIIVLFFLRSASKANCQRILPKVLAYAGTFVPFLIIFMKGPQVKAGSTLLSISIMTGGMMFSLYSLKSLGRSFGITPQARNLVQKGPYRFIRHPLYVGEIVTFAGSILSGFSVEKFCILLILISIQSYRAVQEERLLAEAIPGYPAYQAKTKRFIPGLW
jgi:protein-S-isoprenylcysteine O-methyltransferase Ste14